jgi:alpha-L-rhamnosidase
MHEHYEDCPWREQALYTMDSRNQMLCGYYAYGETKFPRASLELMAHSIRDDNMLELCSPAEVAITIPSFSAIFMVQLQEIPRFFGGHRFCHADAAGRGADCGRVYTPAENEGGLIKCFGEQKYWNFYEWQSGLAGTIGGLCSGRGAHL